MIQGDLIIGADGINSRAVKYVLGYDNPAVPVELSCFRWLAPTQELLDDPETKGLMEDYRGKSSYYVDRTARKRLVCYGCREYVTTILGIIYKSADFAIVRRDKIQNFALFIPDKGVDFEEGWDNGVDTEVLVDQMENFHPSLQAATRHIHSCNYECETR